jgi:pyruvate dehydrogenase E2 component (dihydrolipoamide acetyltransferase)
MSGQVQTQAAAAKAPAARRGRRRHPGLLPWPQVDFAKFGAVERATSRASRRSRARTCIATGSMIPHVTNHDDADITELEAFRVQLNKENEKSGVKVTMLAFLIKAIVSALKKFPDFNASLDGEQLVLKKYFHVGFAADTPNGLVVPVLRDADKKGVMQIAKETASSRPKARDGKLGPADMTGGCFSISSLGGIGVHLLLADHQRARSRHPRCLQELDEPVWDGKAFVPRLILPLSLSYDHRVIDGAVRRALQHLPDSAARRLPSHDAVRTRTWAVIEVQVPDIGDFKDVGVIEVLVKAGRHRRQGAEPHHRRERQGLDGDSLDARGRGQGAARQGSATR